MIPLDELEDNDFVPRPDLADPDFNSGDGDSYSLDRDPMTNFPPEYGPSMLPSPSFHYKNLDIGTVPPRGEAAFEADSINAPKVWAIGPGLLFFRPFPARKKNIFRNNDSDTSDGKPESEASSLPPQKPQNMTSMENRTSSGDNQTIFSEGIKNVKPIPQRQKIDISGRAPPVRKPAGKLHGANGTPSDHASAGDAHRRSAGHHATKPHSEVAEFKKRTKRPKVPAANPKSSQIKS